MEKADKNDEENPKDEYSKTIGDIGIWHIGLFLVLSFPIKMVLPGIQMGITFLAPKTTFACVQRGNISIVPVNNTCYEDCVKYEYYSEINNTIISEWDLVCERAWLANFSQSIIMLGIMVGSAFFSFLSDRYGRRLCLIIASVIETIMCFALPFSPDFWTFLVIRFFLGSVSAGTMVTSFVFLIEIFGAKKRELLGSLYMMPVCLGFFLVTAVAYFTRDWRLTTLGVAMPTLIYLLYIFVLPESPKWLITAGRLDEACHVMETAAKWNNLPTDNIKEAVERISAEALKDKHSETKANFHDLILVKSLRPKILYSCLIWFVVGINVYGTAQYFGQTFPNLFLSTMVTGVFQVPCYLIGGFVSRKFGRRSTIISFLLVSSVSNGLLALSDEWFYLKLIAGSLGIGSSAAVFSLIYVFTPELFPTVTRNMAFGTASVANRAGSMLAPFVGALRVHATWLPPALFAVAPLVGVVACYCLPETKGIKLDDYLDE